MKTKLLLSIACLALIASCSQEQANNILCSEDGKVVVIDRKIDYGTSQEDFTFVKTMRVVKPLPVGWADLDVVLGGAVCAIRFDENGKEAESIPEHVTIINRDTINIHTRYLVEKYRDVLQTPEHPERPYGYLWLYGIYAGRNCTIINDGVINVWFDHDPSCMSTIYVSAISARGGNDVVNSGEINFMGNGSAHTRFRGMSTLEDNVTFLNKGLMTGNVELVEDARFMTGAGNNSTYLNRGVMMAKEPGGLMCMVQAGDNLIVNQGVIDMVSRPYPDSLDFFLGRDNINSAAMNSTIGPKAKAAYPLVNAGTIKVRMEGDSLSNPGWKSYGILYTGVAGTGRRADPSKGNFGEVITENGAIPTKF
ncbi:MAG: hypothetical protein KBS67_04315 [Bacteroidales bacterium]|nr:hypothetical protein [Candidatus Cryptobacteroides equifaecalis]